MIKVGVSIYTGLSDYSVEQNTTYLMKASELGCEIVFTSFHINEASNNYEDLTNLVNQATSLGLKVIIDVSKPMMEKFMIPAGVYALRLDYGFTKEEIVELSKDHRFKIELNASTLSASSFQTLIDLGLDVSNVRVSFNFYPKPYTGHNVEYVRNRVIFFHKYKVRVLAFIPSHHGFRPPLYEGLPTIEKHRHMILDEAVEELKALDIDEIAIGDAYASDEELETIVAHKCDHLMLPITFFKTEEDYSFLLGKLFSIRPDYNDIMLRVSNARGLDEVKVENTIARKKGYVTIDNSDFLRYKGEVNIILQDIPKDERVNVIGKVELSDDIIRALKGGRKFTFYVKTDKYI